MARSLNICMLTDDPSSIGGGPEHIRQISKILINHYGAHVDLVTPKTMADFVFSDFGQRLKYVVWVCRLLLTSDYDIYHSHSFSTSLVLPLAKLRGKKIGLTVHGRGASLAGAGVLNATSAPKLLAQLVLNHWPFDFRLSASKLAGFVVVGNGIDLAEFAKVKRVGHKLFTVLCISRRDPIKGVSILEKAIAKVPNCKLNLVSGRQRTMADFDSADCYVLPSLSEGLPIVLLEAMGARLPIVATDVGDCRSLVEKSGSGLIVPPGDVAALTSGIKKMMILKKRQQMGVNGYEYVKRYYTWRKVTDATWKAYSKVI